jgi:lipopolysaccharide transport system permease protein
MFEAVKEIIKYQDLLFMLAHRDIRIRYKQAAMGFIWAIFMPIVAVCAGILIKKAISIISGKPMDLQGVVSITVKVVPWTFFISALRFSVHSLVGNSNLITKIYFPRAVLPLASVLACMLDFSIAVSVVVVLLIFLKIGISIHLVWLPFLFLFLFLITAGLGLFLSTANLFYRDIKYVVEVILMFGIFFTPVLYEASTFGDMGTLLLINPIGSILESINAIVVLKQAPDLFWLFYSGISAMLMFFFGVKIFNSKESCFAENI